jgi:hypothetical protein
MENGEFVKSVLQYGGLKKLRILVSDFAIGLLIISFKNKETQVQFFEGYKVAKKMADLET